MTRPLAALLALVLAGAACAERPAQDRSAAEATMALLGTARALHHEADVHESTGDFAKAAEAMERVLALRLPPSFAEAEDVRADAWGRLAELDLRRDAPDRALARVDEGLRDVRRESVLKARLHMVRGRALGALAERDARNGDAAAAARRRDEALAELERSIEINGRILRRLTPAPAGSR